MQREQEGLVPIGEALAGLDGPVKAIRKASPQVRRHFTLDDQIDQLIEAREADPDTGFMGRMLALCTLARTNPGNREKYVRRNGPYTLILNAGHPYKLPFGNLSRLLLAWVCTETVRTQSRELVLGRSLYEFMKKLGIVDRSGSKRGDRTRLQNQMHRLFGASITLLYEGPGVHARVSSFVADRHDFWWDPKRPDEPSLWESQIRLGEEFFNEIIRRPLPLDMNTLKALKRSSLGLDLYLWLTYKSFSLKEPFVLTWQQVYRQFGADPAKADDKRTVHDFRRDVLRELVKIKLAWPDLTYATPRGRLVIFPTRPLIGVVNPESGRVSTEGL